MEIGQEQIAFSRGDTKAVKGIAVLLMLLHHLFGFPDRIGGISSYVSLFHVSGKPIEQLVGSFGNICVAMFFCLSGYGTYLWCSNNKENVKKIPSKIKQLYIAYWRIFVVFVPICIIAGSKQIEKKLFVLISNLIGVSCSYNAEWWFLFPFVLLQMLFPLILRWIDRKRGNLLCDVIALITFQSLYAFLLPRIMGYPLFTEFKNSIYWYQLNFVLEWLPSFMIGCICAKYHLFESYLTFFKSRFTRIFSSFMLLLAAFCIRKNAYDPVDYLLAPVVIIACNAIIRDFHGIMSVFIAIGKQSTNMWLIHSFFIYQICQKFVFSPRYSILIFLLLVAMSYFSGVLIDAFFSQLVPAILQIFRRKPAKQYS